MRLYLINPSNPLVSLARVKESRWNRYRVWKPLGLLVLAGLTPPNWEITVVDENVRVPDYSALPRPDLVGITAFTPGGQCRFQVRIALEFACALERENWIIRTEKVELNAKQVFPGSRECEAQFD